MPADAPAIARSAARVPTRTPRLKLHAHEARRHTFGEAGIRRAYSKRRSYRPDVRGLIR